MNKLTILILVGLMGSQIAYAGCSSFEDCVKSSSNTDREWYGAKQADAELAIAYALNNIAKELHEKNSHSSNVS